MKKGDRFVAGPSLRLCERVFIEIQRVAKDGTWVDIVACTWAIMWRKRVPLENGKLPNTEMNQFEWDISDLNRQEADHMKMLRERGIIGQ